jgi:hypothetical protein
MDIEATKVELLSKVQQTTDQVLLNPRVLTLSERAKKSTHYFSSPEQN